MNCRLEHVCKLARGTNVMVYVSTTKRINQAVKWITKELVPLYIPLYDCGLAMGSEVATG